MSKFIYLVAWLVAVSLIGLVGVRLVPQLSLTSCRKPIAYSIGQLDQRFAISKDQLQSIASESEKIWEDVAKRNLFQYRDGDKLTVNLVYDERQALTQKSGELSGNIQANQKTYETLQAKYYQLVAQYNDRLAKYNQEVANWNSLGGAPREEYNRLQQEARKLNAQADEINALAKQLNSLARQLNLRVDQFNTVAGQFNQTLAVKPEAGEFSPAESKITIYQFLDETDLRLTLAHEFGHSLNINHIEVPNAVMNPERSSVTHLTDEDAAALKQVCRLD